MVQGLIAVCLLYISWVDLREHRIYNRDVIIVSALISLDPNVIPVKVSVALLIPLFLATVIFGIGGGDFKLMAALLLAQGGIVTTPQYLGFLLPTLLLSLLISVAHHRTFRCTVPLAPAITLPFLLIYLGM